LKINKGVDRPKLYISNTTMNPVEGHHYEAIINKNVHLWVGYYIRYIINSSFNHLENLENKNELLPILTTLFDIILELLPETDIIILEYLSQCSGKRDYISRIVRSLSLPYSTVYRGINRMFRLGVILKCNSNSKSFSYYQITQIGKIIIHYNIARRNSY